MKTILALDLGTKTGYAFGSGEETTVSGTADFTPKRFEGGGMRFVRFRRWLDQISDTVGFEEVHFEEVRRHNSTDAAHCYGGLMAHLTEWCESMTIPYSGIPVGTIKKFATGNGGAPKTRAAANKRKKKYDGITMDEAVKSWGYEPGDDNEVDALAIFHYVQAEAMAS